MKTIKLSVTGCLGFFLSVGCMLASQNSELLERVKTMSEPQLMSMAKNYSIADPTRAHLAQGRLLFLHITRLPQEERAKKIKELSLNELGGLLNFLSYEAHKDMLLDAIAWRINSLIEDMERVPYDGNNWRGFVERIGNQSNGQYTALLNLNPKLQKTILNDIMAKGTVAIKDRLSLPFQNLRDYYISGRDRLKSTLSSAEFHSLSEFYGDTFERFFQRIKECIALEIERKWREENQYKNKIKEDAERQAKVAQRNWFQRMWYRLRGEN